MKRKTGSPPAPGTKPVAEISKDEWDNLKYSFEVWPLSDEDGGGWYAFIPVLGKMSFCVDGETREEAVRELEGLRRDLYVELVRLGYDVPMPRFYVDDWPQGG